VASASGERRSIQLSYGRVVEELSGSLAEFALLEQMFCPGEYIKLRNGPGRERERGRGDDPGGTGSAWISALVPFGEGQPYDLVVHLGADEFLKVQCKTAWSRQGCIVFNSHSTDHGRGPQSYVGLADIFGVYFPPEGSVYLVPIEAVARFEGRLRFEPARNNQRRRIREAADFGIDQWTVESLREIVRAAAPRDEHALSVA
jgi:hypothetical protein